MRGLRDRVAVVTGAGRGIGAASARRLAAEGAAVVVTDRDENGAIEVAAAIQALGGRAISACADSRRRSDLEAAVTLAREQFGSFDLFHHNAGVGCFGPLESTTEDQIRELVDINVLGMINGLAVAAPALRSGGGGAIVLTGSLVAQHGTAFQIPYIATKGAVSSMTRAPSGPRGCSTRSAIPQSSRRSSETPRRSFRSAAWRSRRRSRASWRSSRPTTLRTSLGRSSPLAAGGRLARMSH
jgi:meso-butanediol dehydrogenase / (S,S)-butanediol dehydrogenase / diacetyl reductase